MGRGLRGSCPSHLLVLLLLGKVGSCSSTARSLRPCREQLHLAAAAAVGSNSSCPHRPQTAERRRSVTSNGMPSRWKELPQCRGGMKPWSLTLHTLMRSDHS